MHLLPPFPRVRRLPPLPGARRMSPLLYAALVAILPVAFAWWMWPCGRTVVFAFYYKRLGDSTATIRVRRFNRKWEQRSVFGACTVWHSAEDGSRQPTHIERLLADRWALEHHRESS